MPKLTKRFIGSVPTPDKDTIHWDDDVPGFGLRIRKSGTKTYVIQYRNSDGKSRRLTIGKVGRITPRKARTEARRRLTQVDLGGDPVEDRRRHRAAPTLKEFAKRYMQEHSRAKKKPSSIKTDERLLRVILLPLLGNKKMASITTEDVAAMHRTRHYTPVQANRAVSLLSKMMNLAERWGVRPQNSNPCRHIDRYPETPRDRYLSPAELNRLGEALDEFEREQRAPVTVILAIRLLLLTGCRRGEIQNLTWDQVDLDRRRLMLSDSKTGFKVVPLAKPAVALLREAPRQKDNPYVCFGQRSPHVTTVVDKYWKKIRLAAELEDVRLHDIRHTFASFGVANQLGLPVVGRVLGHTTLQTTERYAHLSIDPLIEAADQIAREISEALSGPSSIYKAIDEDSSPRRALSSSAKRRHRRRGRRRRPTPSTARSSRLRNQAGHEFEH